MQVYAVYIGACFTHLEHHYEKKGPKDSRRCHRCVVIVMVSPVGRATGPAAGGARITHDGVTAGPQAARRLAGR
jgi:hypothetical protein